MNASQCESVLTKKKKMFDLLSTAGLEVVIPKEAHVLPACEM